MHKNVFVIACMACPGLGKGAPISLTKLANVHSEEYQEDPLSKVARLLLAFNTAGDLCAPPSQQYPFFAEGGQGMTLHSRRSKERRSLKRRLLYGYPFLAESGLGMTVHSRQSKERRSLKKRFVYGMLQLFTVIMVEARGVSHTKVSTETSSTEPSAYKPVHALTSESKPTGLIWPSHEAEAKLRTVDGIELYPTHAWTDEMKPIVNAERIWGETPLMIGVAGDSGCGKSTFSRRILGVLGVEANQAHTLVGDMMSVVCLDDYHINDRAGRRQTGLTALHAKENDFALMGAQIEALKQGKAVYKPIYNHDTGYKDPPELVQPNKIILFEGLHPMYDDKACSVLDLGIYIDIVNEVKFAWKMSRDVTERGWTEEQVQADMNMRLPDFAAYVDPQKKKADVILRYEPSEKGLPFLKVKLIQKKAGAFPTVTLKKPMALTGTGPGATLKMYNDDWFGNEVTVLEMDGEVDMDEMETQLKEIEANLEGFDNKNPTELTDAMMKLKSSVGSQNGTGLFQTVIAVKLREVYEKATSAMRGATEVRSREPVGTASKGL